MEQSSAQKGENSGLQSNKPTQSSFDHGQPHDHEVENTDHTHLHPHNNEVASSKPLQAESTHTHSHEDGSEHSHPPVPVQTNLVASNSQVLEEVHDYDHPHPHATVSSDAEDQHSHSHLHTGDEHAPHPHALTEQAHDHPHAAVTSQHAHDDDHNHGDNDHGDHDHGEHGHDHGKFGWLREILPFGHGHSHDAADSLDDALAGSAEGIRAVKISLLGLGITAILQLVVVVISGSVALLADTIHNFSDAATAIPLWLAFSLTRKPPTRRYTYGYGRAEDMAGIFVVLMIASSTVVAGWVSIERLFNPQPIHQLEWVVAAAIIGFIGNEVVAQYRIRAGERIGSAALVADGYHARTDGFTSLAVLFGAIGVWLGFPLADPLIGIIITVAIAFVLKDAALQIWRRLMDAVDPKIVDGVEKAARQTQGVVDVSKVQARWIGHSIHVEANITADKNLSLSAAHSVAEEVRHTIIHQVRKVGGVTIHVDPTSIEGVDPHASLAHHEHALG